MPRKPARVLGPTEKAWAVFVKSLGVANERQLVLLASGAVLSRRIDESTNASQCATAVNSLNRLMRTVRETPGLNAEAPPVSQGNTRTGRGSRSGPRRADVKRSPVVTTEQMAARRADRQGLTTA